MPLHFLSIDHVPEHLRSTKEPQPRRYILIHVLMRTDLDHNDAIVADVGFAFGGHSGTKKPAGRGLSGS